MSRPHPLPRPLPSPGASVAKACLSPHHFSFLCPPQLGLSQPPPHRCPARWGSCGREVGGGGRGGLAGISGPWMPGSTPGGGGPPTCLTHLLASSWRAAPALPYTTQAVPGKGSDSSKGFHPEGPLLRRGTLTGGQIPPSSGGHCCHSSAYGLPARPAGAGRVDVLSLRKVETS